jgi:hypothetical protein
MNIKLLFKDMLQRPVTLNLPIYRPEVELIKTSRNMKKNTKKLRLLTKVEGFTTSKDIIVLP